MFRDLARGLIDLVFPPACWLCDAPADAGDFCAGCRDELLHDPWPSCPRCGNSLGAGAAAGPRCTRCRTESFAFERVVRLGPYEGRRRELVLRAKYDESVAEAAGRIFADGVSPRLAGIAADLVCAVPLHWKRAWRRRYNQSDVLARALARRLSLPFMANAVRRIRATPLQATLSPTARRSNVRGAFRARSRCVTGRTVILVDDVLTTGSTAHAVAHALQEAGAVATVVAALAHG
jgi:ComF family protein